MSDSEQYDDDHDGIEDLGPLDDTAGVRIPVGPSGEQAPTDALPYGGDDDEVQRVEAALYARIGEQAPERRLTATRRAVELLGDPHLAYPVIHVTGTNGKTSTARMAESIVRAHGLRTGLMTSPHLVSIRERIVIDGEPIAADRFVENWDDITPILAMTDQELTDKGEQPLTFFEALTVLALACFAEAPVDVAVIEVGMGGEWDSTNVVQSQVQVITPVAIDHAKQLGSTVAEIARTKSGIIKPSSSVVSSAQTPEALAELQRAAELTESTLAVEGTGFSVVSDTPAVGGQLVTVQGIAGRYDDLFVPLFGQHQAHNAAVAIAAVESFLGRGSQALDEDVLSEGLANATSPGRLQPIAQEPTVVVDAAHNPHGARALAEALPVAFPSEHVVGVVGILGDKDARGFVRALKDTVQTFVVTQPPGDRALDADAFARIVVAEVGEDRVVVEPALEQALQEARDLAEEADAEDALVLVAGSIVMVGKVMDLVHAESGTK
ncbi:MULTISPECIES: bifunctional folylpolyglutamate synthase/dihydrofolate synthase [unclassified Curtobacterium]|uniref:bifunctional folylpolyglutamate synthase/dihydrofolate synthase n=1 Tax=unclassified Curtobacterium TaxID=257496 RepID=UPI0009DD7B73|nr:MULTISPECIES: folylpolyglutamate synthase/dihydrofolate synthase family protein [unclassified Curtobacterium]MBP1300836.1 dihydrofolate synthase/folylpolyglutamate synthase [Curtobacterium sp. 1310]MDB6428693.1 bifunctional folylpolyglutamate synthase/dihydrofolate synthase [Curtobacterium sp. 20TX0008]